MTDEQRWLARKYIAYETLTSLWFVGAVWLYFYRLFITDQQIGLLDGLAFAIALLAEVPSGVLADKFGRDRLVKLGQILAGSGLLIQAFGDSFTIFFIGQVVMMVGASFVSGADEALFFGKLNFAKDSSHWRKLLMRSSQVGLIGTILAITAGGWLHTIDPRLPWILNGLSFISAAILIWPVKETISEKRKQNFLPELRQHLASIKNGFYQFRLPKLWFYVPIIITVQGLYYTIGWGLLRIVLLDRFHFDPFLGSVAIAVSSLVSIGALSLMHRYTESLTEKGVISVISLSAALCLILSVPDVGLWGFIAILVFYVGEYVLYPYMSDVLNNNSTDAERATVLSVASFLRTLPYVILAPIIGYLNNRDKLEYFLIVWAILIGFATLIYILRKKKDIRKLAGDESFEDEPRLPEVSSVSR
jgi:MFS family permease